MLAMMTTLVKVEVVTKDVFVAIMMMMMVEDLVQLTSKWIYIYMFVRKIAQKTFKLFGMIVVSNKV